MVVGGGGVSTTGSNVVCLGDEGPGSQLLSPRDIEGGKRGRGLEVGVKMLGLTLSGRIVL